MRPRAPPMTRRTDPGYDDRRTLSRWLIAATVALVVVTTLALVCLARHL
jgi:hypothetical protein